MMKTRFLLLFTLFSLFAQAQNIEVYGLQSGIWEADTVFVSDNVIIRESLDIAAGTVVVFNDFYSISISENATLNALGTKNDSILFTVTDTTGFHFFNVGRGGWNGIRMEKAGSTKFDYCRFQYGKAALNSNQDGGALRIFDCDDVEISHSTLFCNFSREHGGALNAENSTVTIHDCKVDSNLTYSGIDTIYYMYGGGLRFLKCEVDITTTTFCNNCGQNAIGGALSLDSCAVNIDRCRFEHNIGINGGGLYLIRSHNKPCSITNSLFANNISGHFGGGLAISESSPFISNLTVTGNHSIGVNCGGIFFYQHSSPTVWNCIVYDNTNEAPLEEPVQMWAWTYDGYAPEFHNCLIQYGLEKISNHEVITVYKNCMDEDPRFVNPEHEDFHLAADSPCINAGHTFGTEGFDLDGIERVCGEQIDIGAFEYVCSETETLETYQNEQPFRIIGNPVTAASYAEIELDKACYLEAAVYSFEGKLLVHNSLESKQAGLNRIEIGELFQTLPKGAYLLMLKANDKTVATKLIK